MSKIIAYYRYTQIAVFLAVYLLITSAAAYAKAPLQKTQVPGYYRVMIGQFEITALYDGFIEIDTKLLKNATESEIKELMDRMRIDTAKVPTAVNAYLVNTGRKLVLVDAGSGNVFGPTLGKLLSNLKAANHTPEQIDAVMITHMHGDHIGGILDPAGKPVFKNACIYVSKAENDFWLSTDEAKKAPVEFQKYFTLARDLASPYIDQKKWKALKKGEQPIPGIKMVPIPGHTPGHVAYEVTSDGKSLLITGDMVHNIAVQSSRPDVAVEFDSDSKQAVDVRQELFKTAAAENVLLAGMHLPFPGIGRLRDDGNHGYTWIPIHFAPLVDHSLKSAGKK